MIIILLHDQLGRIQPVNPGWNFFVILTFAGDSVNQDSAIDIRTAEQADGFFQFGANPIRFALIIDFKHGSIEHKSRIIKTQMTHQIAAKMFWIRVFDAFSFRQTDYIYILSYHINDQIGRNAVTAVSKPFNQIAVLQHGYSYRPTIVVNLIILVGHFKLADHIRELAQFPVAKFGSGVFIQHGNLVKRDFFHVRNKIAVLYCEQFRVRARAQNHTRKQRPAQV